MKPVTKTVAGMVAAALIATAVAAPAEARRYGRWHHSHHDDVDAGDVLAGIAIIGGIAAIASAVSRPREPRYVRDENPYRAVVNSCGSEADQAYGRGNVRVTHVEQVDAYHFRVTGEVDRGGGYFGREEPAYDDYQAEAEAEDESSAVIGQERYYDSEARQRERQRQAEAERDRAFTFTCTAMGNGRIVEFAANDY